MKEKKQKDIELAILNLKRGYPFKSLPFHLRDMEEVALMAFKVKKKNCFSDVSKRLRDNTEVFEAAICVDILALKYASDRIKQNKELVIKAIQENPINIKSVHESLLKDKKEIVHLLDVNNNIFQYLDDTSRNDIDIASHAVRLNGMNFQYVSNELKENVDFTKSFMLFNCNFLSLIPESIKNNRDVALEIIEKYGYALKHFSEKIKDDKEIALLAVRKNGFALNLVSEELKSDIDVVSAAISQNGEALKYANKELHKNKEILKKAIKSNIDVLEFIDNKIWHNDDNILLYIINRTTNFSSGYKIFPEDEKANMKYIKILIEKNYFYSLLELPNSVIRDNENLYEILQLFIRSELFEKLSPAMIDEKSLNVNKIWKELTDNKDISYGHLSNGQNIPQIKSTMIDFISIMEEKKIKERISEPTIKNKLKKF